MYKFVEHIILCSSGKVHNVLYMLSEKASKYIYNNYVLKERDFFL